MRVVDIELVCVEAIQVPQVQIDIERAVSGKWVFVGLQHCSA